MPPLPIQILALQPPAGALAHGRRRQGGGIGTGARSLSAELIELPRASSPRYFDFCRRAFEQDRKAPSSQARDDRSRGGAARRHRLGHRRQGRERGAAAAVLARQEHAAQARLDQDRDGFVVGSAGRGRSRPRAGRNGRPSPGARGRASPTRRHRARGSQITPIPRPPGRGPSCTYRVVSCPPPTGACNLLWEPRNDFLEDRGPGPDAVYREELLAGASPSRPARIAACPASRPASSASIAARPR